MCVKCRLDGELSAGRKASDKKMLAVQVLHPAAAHDRYEKSDTCYA